jgi:antitoxin component YwqK of YwqJK toxin-antitoxin module
MKCILLTLCVLFTSCETNQNTNEPLPQNHTGIWKTYHPNGNIKTIDTFKTGKRHGYSIEFHKSKEIDMESFYQNGRARGVTKIYYYGATVQDENGKPLPNDPGNHNLKSYEMQVFDKDKKKWLVIYDGSSNVFKDIRHKYKSEINEFVAGISKFKSDNNVR